MCFLTLHFPLFDYTYELIFWTSHFGGTPWLLKLCFVSWCYAVARSKALMQVTTLAYVRISRRNICLIAWRMDVCFSPIDGFFYTFCMCKRPKSGGIMPEITRSIPVCCGEISIAVGHCENFRNCT